MVLSCRDSRYFTSCAESAGALLSQAAEKAAAEKAAVEKLAAEQRLKNRGLAADGSSLAHSNSSNSLTRDGSSVGQMFSGEL